jgi:hypothetical protein
MGTLSLREPIDTEKWYVISGERLERVRLHILRLYGETRWKPDEMRDSAHRLAFVVEEAEEHHG